MSGLESLALADHPHAHTVAVQFGQVVADEAAQQPEQVADLFGRPRPVFRAEGENRQIGDAEFAGAANDLAQRLDAAPMALAARQSARGGPAAVAIHDDGDVARYIGRH